MQNVPQKVNVIRKAEATSFRASGERFDSVVRGGGPSRRFFLHFRDASVLVLY
ncbi:MAG: hypothetical protein ACI8T1_004603 [Verrucomicrobiales bacterium]|jgi:hypothetical protein